MKRMDESQARALTVAHGAMHQGHFIGTQGDKPGLGLHMPEYFDSRTLVTQPAVIHELAEGIAELLAPYDIDTVVGMPIGALTLGHEVAKELGVRYAIAEKSDGKLVIVRSAFVEAVQGKRIALVEDTICDGTTIRKGIEAVRACGGDLVVIGGIINRGSTSARELGVPLHTLISKPMHQITREECLASGQCADGEPINRRPGHGHDLERLVNEGIVPASGYSFV